MGEVGGERRSAEPPHAAKAGVECALAVRKPVPPYPVHACTAAKLPPEKLKASGGQQLLAAAAAAAVAGAPPLGWLPPRLHAGLHIRVCKLHHQLAAADGGAVQSLNRRRRLHVNGYEDGCLLRHS